MTKEQLALSEYMSDLSESYWFAGWMTGLEFMLWDLVSGKTRELAGVKVPEEEIAELKRLSSECSGWIVWDDASGESFVPLEEWKETIRRHQVVV